MFAAPLLPHEIDSLPIGERIKATVDQAEEDWDDLINDIEDQLKRAEYERDDAKADLVDCQIAMADLLAWLEDGEGSSAILQRAHMFAERGRRAQEMAKA